MEATIRKMMIDVREMIAASKLLRGRIESNDEVLRLVQNRMAKIEQYQAELDRRLTRMENQQAITNRNRRIGGDS